MASTPLRQRKYDWFFIVIFCIFIINVVVLDSIIGLNWQLRPDSGNPIEQFMYHRYAKHADPLLIRNPLQVRVSAWISATIFFPLYFFFVVGFVKGWNKMRVPALVYGGALTHGMITYMAEGLFGFMPTEGWKDASICPGCTKPDKFYYLAANLLYLLVPLLMIIRFWKPQPFGPDKE